MIPASISLSWGTSAPGWSAWAGGAGPGCGAGAAVRRRAAARWRTAADRLHARAGGGAYAEPDGIRRRDAAGGAGSAGGGRSRLARPADRLRLGGPLRRQDRYYRFPKGEDARGGGPGRSAGTASCCWTLSARPRPRHGCGRSRRSRPCAAPGGSNTTGTRTGVRWREGNDLPPGGQRLASPYDLDARYGVKRGAGWTGYKDHLTETCDPDMPRVITNVETTHATADDVEMTQTIHQHLDRRRLAPAGHVVDAATSAPATSSPPATTTASPCSDLSAPTPTRPGAAAPGRHRPCPRPPSHRLGRAEGHLPPGSGQRQLVLPAQTQRHPDSPGPFRARRLPPVPAAVPVHHGGQWQVGTQPDPAAPRAA